MDKITRELLDLDLITLQEYDGSNNNKIDPENHLIRLQESIKISEIIQVRRNDCLIAYAMLNKISDRSWFVRGFTIHPENRTASVIRELLKKFVPICEYNCISELRSHVYKANTESVNFHKKLGFSIVKENKIGVEFYASMNLETAVGHGRKCRDAVRQQGVTTLRAHAREEEQRRWRAAARRLRLCSALTPTVSMIVGTFDCREKNLPAATQRSTAVSRMNCLVQNSVIRKIVAYNHSIK